MTEGSPVLFDRIGLYHIERFWWKQRAARSLNKLFLRFLEPNPGRAWLRVGKREWLEAREDTIGDVGDLLEQLTQVWLENSEESVAASTTLQKSGSCAFFIDAERFNACRGPGDPVEVPFFLCFEADWSMTMDGADTVFTPHLRITNHWPTLDIWSPPDPGSPPPVPLTGSDAADLLDDAYLFGVKNGFGAIQAECELLRANLDLGTDDQQATLFYFASPTRKCSRPEEYLEGEHLRALNALGGKVLASPDLQSTEITGGVLEGCLATFAHSAKVSQEYCLMIPLAGFDEAMIEGNIRYCTYFWHDLDLDATWKLFRINMILEEVKEFIPLWQGSLDLAMRFGESLFPLLKKETIQKRMFDLAHLLGGFLAKLQGRAAAAALRQIKAKQDLDWAIRASKGWAEQKFTVRRIPGVELMPNIDQGYTRVHRGFEANISKRADAADELSRRIEDTANSLSLMADLEQQRRQRAEEKASKLLNQVLALVAVLAAIPLIFGAYDNESLSSIVRRIPVELDWLPFDFWTVGLYVSFASAIIAVGLTGWAVLKTFRGEDTTSREESIRTAEGHSETLFESYEVYKSSEFRQAVFGRIRIGAYSGGETWEEASQPSREARAFVHDFDLQTAKAVAAALEQCARWDDLGPLPEGDEAWAKRMEYQICRFVVLSDVFDLRPEDLHLPLTLSLLKHRYADAGLGSPSVSENEYWEVFRAFGFSPSEVEVVHGMGEEIAERTSTPTQFVEAMAEQGVSARHDVTFAEEEDRT